MSAGQDSGALPDLVASQLYTAVVSDILDDLGHRDHVLDPAIRPLGPGEVIVGPANPFLVTEVRQIPAEPYAGEIGALDDVRPGEIILVAAGGSARAACWGELFSTAARARGARGTLIDGYCRDARGIADLGYPVWCRGMLPLDCKGRAAVTAWRQPAVVGGLPVRPGDLVVADADGAVVVPAELIGQTIRQALAKASKEHRLRDALEAGSTLRAAYDRFGVLLAGPAPEGMPSQRLTADQAPVLHPRLNPSASHVAWTSTRDGTRSSGRRAPREAYAVSVDGGPAGAATLGSWCPGSSPGASLAGTCPGTRSP